MQIQWDTHTSKHIARLRWKKKSTTSKPKFKSLCKSPLFCYPFFCHFWLTFCDCARSIAFPFFSPNFSKFTLPDTLNSNIMLTNGLSECASECVCGHDAELKCHKWGWCTIMKQKKSFVFIHWLWSMYKYMLSDSKAILLGWDGLTWHGMAWDVGCFSKVVHFGWICKFRRRNWRFHISFRSRVWEMESELKLSDRLCLRSRSCTYVSNCKDI